MTFGGAACPPQWGCISETNCNVVNNVLQYQEWNHMELHSPIQDSIPLPSYLPESTPFKALAKLAVTVPINDKGKADVYIDNVIAICPDIEDNAAQTSAATPLAIHSRGRQLLSTCEPIPCDDLLSLNKLAAEGQMSEIKTKLGWVINTRSLKISLSSAKYIAWSRNTQSLIECQCATKQLKH